MEYINRFQRDGRASTGTRSFVPDQRFRHSAHEAHPGRQNAFTLTIFYVLEDLVRYRDSTTTPNTVTTPAIPSTTETPTLTRPRHCYNAHHRPPSPPRLHTAYHHRQPSPIRNSAAHNHTDHKRCSGNHILLRHNNKPITSNYLRYASQNACYPSLCLYADAVNHTLLPLF